MKGPVVLLTDFGLRDHYVGVMKGVILSRVPEAVLVDLTHEIPPQNVRAAAYELAVSWSYFPEGSVFLCVVDPGVGTARRALAAVIEGRFFVGPDNGLLTLVLRRHGAFEIRAVEAERFSLPGASTTFHGRDLFAPVAAEILRGRPLRDFGPRIEDPVLLPFPEPEPVPGGWRARVLRVDRFGNLILNLSVRELPFGSFRVEVEGRRVPLARTYAEVPEGEPLALIGSDGFLEIAVNRGSAAELFGEDPEILVLKE
ncbi:S-adenosyl-l-methionine hydroxide adenosyltransferase family protein [Thermosulfurimonas sp. F29]|uniref:SAM hydrolase/SAM-dependent halogenase family protein n=1 Tax=Thermosulfurimonas sp. F29 TaxID=2867247 RepID=UPI001C82B1FA|nr:SAM-dependent chlorinase/fluorinase [Thermosulfurimonas sp. F29]MBX6422493.1 SAM-dependent chlorinase/fluorinase [Thermosulfurimonas sp. F29]